MSVTANEPGTAAEHVFAGTPDARQGTSVATPVSVFRPRYRALAPHEKELHDAIKLKAEELNNLFMLTNPGRYRSLGATALEEAVMWAVKGLTS